MSCIINQEEKCCMTRPGHTTCPHATQIAGESPAYLSAILSLPPAAQTALRGNTVPVPQPESNISLHNQRMPTLARSQQLQPRERLSSIRQQGYRMLPLPPLSARRAKAVRAQQQFVTRAHHSSGDSARYLQTPHGKCARLMHLSAAP